MSQFDSKYFQTHVRFTALKCEAAVPPYHATIHVEAETSF